MSRRAMDILTAYVWASYFGLVFMLVSASALPPDAGQARITSMWVRVIVVIPVIAVMLFALSNLAAVIVQWIVVVLFAIRHRFWGWFALCVVLNIVGSTLAYLILRDQWDGVNHARGRGETVDAWS